MIEIYISYVIYWFSLMVVVLYVVRKPKEVKDVEKRV